MAGGKYSCCDGTENRGYSVLTLPVGSSQRLDIDSMGLRRIYMQRYASLLASISLCNIPCLLVVVLCPPSCPRSSPVVLRKWHRSRQSPTLYPASHLELHRVRSQVLASTATAYQSTPQTPTALLLASASHLNRSAEPGGTAAQPRHSAQLCSR